MFSKLTVGIILVYVHITNITYILLLLDIYMFLLGTKNIIRIYIIFRIALHFFPNLNVLCVYIFSHTTTVNLIPT